MKKWLEDHAAKPRVRNIPFQNIKLCYEFLPMIDEGEDPKHSILKFFAEKRDPEIPSRLVVQVGNSIYWLDMNTYRGDKLLYKEELDKKGKGKKKKKHCTLKVKCYVLKAKSIAQAASFFLEAFENCLSQSSVYKARTCAKDPCDVAISRILKKLNISVSCDNRNVKKGPVCPVYLRELYNLGGKLLERALRMEAEREYPDWREKQLRKNVEVICEVIRTVKRRKRS